MSGQGDATSEIERLLRNRVPDVANGRIEIKGIAREKGVRTLVLLRGDVPDTVGRCVGHRGGLIKSLVAEAGEKIDLALWSDSPEQLIANTILPIVPRKIEIDTIGLQATVWVRPAEDIDPVRLRLASSATGWTIRIRSSG